jgi:hypothetical protein
MLLGCCRLSALFTVTDPTSVQFSGCAKHFQEGPQNCRSLGFARDDKGEGGAPIWGDGINDKGVECRASIRHPSVQQPLSFEAPPFPLSSRAKPRDLQFRGPFLEMFFDAR